MKTSRGSLRYGSGLSNTALTTLKIAVFAPMPRASVRTAVAVKPGFFINIRAPKRRSCQSVCISNSWVNGCAMEIPGLGLKSRNCGAAVGASATDWQPRVYANRRESRAEESVRLWEAAIPKLNSWERRHPCLLGCRQLPTDRCKQARMPALPGCLRSQVKKFGVVGSGAPWPGCRRLAYRTIDGGCFCLGPETTSRTLLRDIRAGASDCRSSTRSEERRVGKECRYRVARAHEVGEQCDREEGEA